MLKRNSVLLGREIQNHNGIEFKELSNIPKINLRGKSNDKDFMASISKILNTPLPTKPNIRNTNNELQVMWLSPNEWLIQINNENRFEKLFFELQSKLNPKNTAITDVTENRTIIRVWGVNLYKLLAKFMVSNLDEVLKKESSISQTIFIKIPILIIRNHKNKEEPSIDIHTNRSHANYIFTLLVDGTHNLDF